MISEILANYSYMVRAIFSSIISTCKESTERKRRAERLSRVIE